MWLTKCHLPCHPKYLTQLYTITYVWSFMTSIVMAIDGSLFPSEKLSNVILMKNQKGLSDDLSDSTSQKAKKQGEMPLTIPFIKINVEFRDGIGLRMRNQNMESTNQCVASSKSKYRWTSLPLNKPKCFFL